jgi:hypothetical protein
MAWVEDVFGGLGSNVLLWVGLTMAAPVVLPTAGALIRPVAKGVINGYFALTEFMHNGAGGTEHRHGNTVQNGSARGNAQRSAEAKRRVGTPTPHTNHQKRSPGRKQNRAAAKTTSAARAL